MDNPKQSRTPSDTGQSEDLIAELARLVARDAQGRPGAPAAERREPALDAGSEAEFAGGGVALDPADGPRGAPVAARSEPSFSPDAVEPRFDEPQAGVRDPQPEADPFAFDFGLGTAKPRQPEPQPEPEAFPEAAPQDPGYDPIAALIETVKEEALQQEQARFETDRVEDDAPEAGAAFADFPSIDAAADDRFERAPDADPFGHQPVAVPAPEPEAPAFSQAAIQRPVAMRTEPVLGAETPPAGQGGERDPLADIESLIGEAARVEFEPPRRANRPVIAPETISNVPSGPEAAVLAAAAAARGRPEPEPFAAGAFEEDEADEGFVAEDTLMPEDEAPVPPRRRRRVGMLIPVAAGLAIIVAAGAGAYYMLGSDGPGGEAPVLSADGSPIREEPQTVANTTAASQSIVFGEIEGNTTFGSDEQLVSRDETEGVTGTDISRVIATDTDESGLANRRVRTVTVRPDGTIVSGEDAAAGTAALPVDRPDVPPVPNSTLTDDPIGEAIAAAIGGNGDAATLPAPEAPEATGTDAPAAPPAAATGPSDPDAPQPLPRPAGLNLSSAPTPTTAAPQQTLQVAAANLDEEGVTAGLVPPQEPAATPAPAPVAATEPTPAPVETAAVPAAQQPAGAFVQLSSQRSEDAARQTMTELQTRFGSLFGGAQPEINRVDLAERGIYYRVRLPQPSLSNANSVCNAIQSAGGDCFVLAN